MTDPTVGVVLLSMGNRPEELTSALVSLHQQRHVELDVVLVGNGWKPEGVPDWVRTFHVDENLGVPGGRNHGAALAKGEYLFFYDDDGCLATPDTLRGMVDKMQPDVALVQPRGVDPNGTPSPRRWVPRLFMRNELKPGDVVVFWEAMAMIRRSAFEEAGGWPAEFFFAHEGIDLALRLLDRGWRLRYEPSLVVHHPAHPAARHAIYLRTNARNRVWVARRNLPGLLVPAYLSVWIVATVVRIHHVAPLREWFKGFTEGWSGPVPGGRTPISWKTILKMTTLGRPPLW